MLDKQLNTIGGIYKITSLINGKFYIGSAKSLLVRAKQHIHMLKRNKHHNRHLQNSYRKYGPSNIEVSVLMICSESDLLFYEQRFIDAMSPQYNLCKQAGSSAGRILSDEHKERIRASVSSSWTGDEERRKATSLRSRDYTHDAHALEKISESSKGRVHSDETREKIRKLSTGRKHTAESRAKMSASRNRVVSEKRAKLII